MRKQTGWIRFVMIFVAAVFGLSVFSPRKSSNPSGGESAEVEKPSHQESLTRSLANLQSSCLEIERRILAFLPEETVPAPDDCYTGPKKVQDYVKSNDKEQTELHFIIATLPDPVHTHFSLLFDRLTNALQQSAQDQGYNYDSSWLPWAEQSPRYELSGDQKKPGSRREAEQPGILVFRKSLEPCEPQSAGQTVPPTSAADQNRVKANGPKQQSANASGPRYKPYKQGLVVFVVAENPTGGIDVEQFEEAVKWIKAIRPNGTKQSLRILGPFFSGSFPSLARALTRGSTKKYISKNRDQFKDSVASSVEVFSGSTTSRLGIEWFRGFLAQEQLGRFLTFQEDDNLLVNRFCRVLRGWGYDTGRLAIVSEDETAFGASLTSAVVSSSDDPLNECVDQTNKHGPLYLYYPRDIASLRAAYEKQSGSEGSQEFQPTGSTGLSGNLAESGSSERDSIRSYGGAQTPLSLDSTLIAMVDLLRSHHIEFIVLRSSNVVDQIFLARFFGGTYSDGRIVITNSDLMFRRTTQGTSLRGTMTLSTYPLLTWQQDWTFWQTPASRHSHRAFPDSDAEGLYLAGRFLIGFDDSSNATGPLTSSSSVLLRDYGPPSWMLRPGCAGAATRPPTWLSVLGNGQLWPVAVLREPDAADPPELKATISQTHKGETREKEIEDKRTGQEQKCRDEYTQSWALSKGTNSAADVHSPDSVLPLAMTSAPYHAAQLQLTLPILICFGLGLVLCLWHLYCCAGGSQTADPRCRAYFAPVPGPEHKILIFLGCALLALMAVLFACFTGTLYVGKTPFAHELRMNLFDALMVLLALAALLLNYYLPAREAKERCGRDLVVLVGASLLAALVMVVISVFSGLDKHGWLRDIFGTLAFVFLLAAIVRYYYWPEKDTVPQGKIESSRLLLRLLFRRRVRWGETACRLISRALEWLQKPRRTLSLASGLFLVIAVAFVYVFHFLLFAHVAEENRVFIFWRTVNLFSGVSPLVPFLLLTAGMYAWFWYTLSGMALFNCDRPQLPRKEALRDKTLGISLPMFSRNAGIEIEEFARPLNVKYSLVFFGLLAGLIFAFIFFILSEDFSLRGLGPKVYGNVFFVSLSLCVAIILADACQLLVTWARLRQLLVYLDRLPLRSTLSALKGFSWGTVWKMGGSVMDKRYLLLSRQIESFRHLRNAVERWQVKEKAKATKELDKVGESAMGEATGGEEASSSPPTSEDFDRPFILPKSFKDQLAACESSLRIFTGWYTQNYDNPYLIDVRELKQYQAGMAKTAGAVCMKILLPEWRRERQSLILDLSPSSEEGEKDNKQMPSTVELPEHQRAAEEFFALGYLGFVQNILGRMRTMAMAMLWLFIAAALSVASYPFDPRPVLSGVFLFVFVATASVVGFVYAQMHRDATLSHITNTKPGELGVDFWIKLISVGAGPLLALLAALFPDITSFLTSWLQPSVEAIK